MHFGRLPLLPFSDAQALVLSACVWYDYVRARKGTGRRHGWKITEFKERQISATGKIQKERWL